MNTQIPDIFVAEGELKGRRFAVTAQGVRLGRSSSCEVSIQDPALSRNHCLFEIRDGSLWITDLASANGTFVNGDMLGADSRRLKPGDRVSIGETLLVVGDAGGESDASAVAPEAVPEVDLGLGPSPDAPAADDARSVAIRRFAVWGAAALAVAGAAVLILVPSPQDGAAPGDAVVTEELPSDDATLKSMSFEKVEADGRGIYRYALSLDAKGVLNVEIDDVPKENRHLRKSVSLKPAAFERLAAILSLDSLSSLDPEYVGVPLRPNTLKSCRLKVVRGSRVFSTTVENVSEPAAFRSVRENLETFSKNELGIWAMQFSAEKLVEMSGESRRAADAKWEERDVQFGNVAAALAAYKEAVFYLETVNPKPADYGALVNRCREAEKELDRRCADRRFLADRAISLQDWKTAVRELRALCELVPDSADSRHAEAAAKLMDVEARLRRGGAK